MITTNADGIATSDAHALPYGSYLVKETKPSKGYLLNTEWSRVFTIREDGKIVDLTEDKVREAVIRGGVQIIKRDKELVKAEALGGARLDDIVTLTVTGAIEWIICYSRDTWKCPVVFYTGSWYESAEYAAMVDRLYEIQKKWGIGIIDLYTDEAVNAIDEEAYADYMADPIHPTRAGYTDWWFPKMERDLINILE